MTLTLLAVSLNERPLSQPITAHFDSRGGTIGRADHNTMALPDPERHVSRLQAEIVANGPGFVIRNVGAANAIVVAGRPVTCGETASLDHGDEIRIGGYLLQADMRTQEAALDVTRGRAMISASMAPAPVSLPPAAAPAAVPGPRADFLVSAAPPTAGGISNNNPFADLLGGGSLAPTGAPSPNDPFADMFGSPAPRPTAAPAAMRTAPGSSLPSGTSSASAAPASAARASRSSNDPFADLMPPPAGVLPSSAGFAPAPAAEQARLPDDFDPFASLPTPTRAPAPAPSDPFADLMPASAPSSIDAMFGLDPAAPDPLANFMAKPLAPASAGNSAALGVPADPLQALFGDEVATPVGSARAQNDHLPALNAAYQPPRVVAAMQAPAGSAPGQQQIANLAPMPASAPTQAAAAASTLPADLPLTFDSGPPPLAVATPAQAPTPGPASRQVPGPGAGEADAQRLWAAICQGAEIQMPLAPGAAEERMHELGRILRSAVDGTLRLMAVRASTKHELRADVTVIQSRGNNPLKFSPDAKSGLESLLQPPVRGFLEGAAAMDDAMHDLVGHSIGTVAGMRAAIGGMLDRFGPEQLEAKLTGKSVLDSVLPISRKAKLWDLYLQHHDAIREEAQEDFHNLFGKAFLAAYEQQIAQLRRSKPNP